jgi:hypothetical protein
VRWRSERARRNSGGEVSLLVRENMVGCLG